MILQAIVGPPLVSESGDGKSMIFCSGCMLDIDFGRSCYAIGCGQVDTQDSVHAILPSV